MSKKKKAPKTVAAALKACRAAFRKHPEATYAWCCHHKVRLEPLHHNYSKWSDRIAYILSDKEKNELVVRFNNFRPFTGKFKGDEVRLHVVGGKARQHEKDAPFSSWDKNRMTIF